MKNQHLFLKRYRPPQPDMWNGRDDGHDAKRYHQIIQFCDLRKFPELPKNCFALLGFCCDVGVRRNHGNRGAAEGPLLLRQSLANLPFLPPDAIQFFDCGDILCEDDHLEEAQDCLSEVVEYLLERDVKPILIGGGHEIAWGNYQGILKAFSEDECSIINFDAHYDLRPLLGESLGTSGTSFHQIARYLENQNKDFKYGCFGIQKTGNTSALFKKADELKVLTVFAEQFYKDGLESVMKSLTSFIKGSKNIYLTLCLDVFATPYAPGVSARQPLGLTPWQVIPLIQQLSSCGKILSFDIAELCPNRDWDNTTALLAASLITCYINSYTFEEQEKIRE